MQLAPFKYSNSTPLYASDQQICARIGRVCTKNARGKGQNRHRQLSPCANIKQTYGHNHRSNTRNIHLRTRKEHRAGSVAAPRRKNASAPIDCDWLGVCSDCGRDGQRTRRLRAAAIKRRTVFIAATALFAVPRRKFIAIG